MALECRGSETCCNALTHIRRHVDNHRGVVMAFAAYGAETRAIPREERRTNSGRRGRMGSKRDAPKGLKHSRRFK